MYKTAIKTGLQIQNLQLLSRGGITNNFNLGLVKNLVLG